ncbi:MAG TPA: FAD-binding oxidoreductase [Povalibacter sp.]
MTMKRRLFLQASVGAAALWPARMLFADGVGPLSDMAAKSLTGGELTLRGVDVQDLAAGMRGQVLVGGQAGYEEARHVWNGMFDKHPAVIARCASPSDVMRAVTFAREHQLLTAVRCGGHSLSGKSACDGGIVIDLSPMQGVRVDADAKIARVEGGALLRHLDRETRAFGLVTTAGTVSHTGVGGLTLGGGFGRVGRRFGLACDNVQAVDIVTADGRLITANAKHNPDLLWAVRGGGGNFGVVTSFEFRLHAMDPMVLAGDIAWPMAQGREVMHFIAEFSANAPDELNLDLSLVPGGPDGKGMVVAEACWSGDKSQGERVLQPLRTFGKPMFDHIAATSYVGLQASGDEMNAAGQRVYVKAGFFSELTTANIDLIVETAQQAVANGAVIAMAQGGGAIGRAAVDSAAYPNRRAKFWVMVVKAWQDPAQDRENIGHVRAAWKALEPFSDGFYVNAMSEDEYKRVAANYGGNYQRLQQAKKKYDPTNQFRLNANVLPG